ncbi:MAG: hypothetical protein E7Z90_04680 [Cyanobacteria bacterium SIG29]|nr:hypothetical protein [Cyanobacteria bacterium SIG29]
MPENNPPQENGSEDITLHNGHTVNMDDFENTYLFGIDDSDDVDFENYFIVASKGIYGITLVI